MQDRTRGDLVLVSGAERRAVATAAEALRDPGTVVVDYDLSGLAEGVVHRGVRSADPAADRRVTVLELAHGCVSCTLREDVLPLLRRLAAGLHGGRVVLALDPGMEPEAVCESLAYLVEEGADSPVTALLDLAGVVTVLDGARWLDDAGSDDALVDPGHGLAPDDDRTVAQLVVGAAEFADVLVVAGSPPDEWERVRRDAVLDRLAPQARRLHVASPECARGAALRALLADPHPEARRGVGDDPHGPLLRARPPLRRDAGVSLVHIGHRRPFHPERLHEAFDVLLTGTIRARGRIWVASQPEHALWVESAGGGLRIAHAGPWLAADPELWDTAGDERRVAAALRWDERFGDREQQLVVLVHDADPAAIVDALDAALLSDDELAAGEAAWRDYEDPFLTAHADPCEDLVAGAEPPTEVHGE